MIQDVAEVEWILNADFEPIFRYLVNERLCFEALVKQEHLGVLLTLLHRYPGLRVVIDHAAKPRIASAEFLEWSSSIKLIIGQVGNKTCIFIIGMSRNIKYSSKYIQLF